MIVILVLSKMMIDFARKWDFKCLPKNGEFDLFKSFDILLFWLNWIKVDRLIIIRGN